MSAVRNYDAAKPVLLAFLLLVVMPPCVLAKTFEAEISISSGQAGSDSAQALTVSSPDGPWKEAFERICAQTEVATSLSKEQLEKLVSDADVLIGELRDVEDPWAKVYIFRLEKCRDFFEFTLQWQAMELQSES